MLSLLSTELNTNVLVAYLILDALVQILRIFSEV